MLSLEERSWSTINQRGNPGIFEAGFDEVDELRGETKGSDDLEEEGVIDLVEGIGHVELDQYPLLFPLLARVYCFLHLNEVVQDLSAFVKPPLRTRN